MANVNIDFYDTVIYHKPGQSPRLSSRVSAFITEHKYPVELQWSANTLLATILSHYQRGIDVTSQAYCNGLHDVFEAALERGRQSLKERAIRGMTQNADP